MADELGAKASDRLGVELAHAAFGDVEYTTDFFEVKILVVVKTQNEPLLLGELFNGVGHDVFDGFEIQLIKGIIDFA